MGLPLRHERNPSCPHYTHFPFDRARLALKLRGRCSMDRVTASGSKGAMAGTSSTPLVSALLASRGHCPPQDHTLMRLSNVS
jgi:hypothetical protein